MVRSSDIKLLNITSPQVGCGHWTATDGSKHVRAFAMKALIILCCIALFAVGCDIGDPFPFDGISITFAVTDTLGKKTSYLLVGEPFELHFTLTNSTGSDLTYHYTGPPVVLRVQIGDSTVASSVDGLAWVMIVRQGMLASGGSYSVTWRAPNTPWSGRQITLLPGQYYAGVQTNGFFDKFRLQPVAPIGFTIYPRNPRRLTGGSTGRN